MVVLEFGNKASANQYVKFAHKMDKRTGMKHSYRLSKMKDGWKVTQKATYKRK